MITLIFLDYAYLENDIFLSINQMKYSEDEYIKNAFTEDENGNNGVANDKKSSIRTLIVEDVFEGVNINVIILLFITDRCNWGCSLGADEILEVLCTFHGCNVWD